MTIDREALRTRLIRARETAGTCFTTLRNETADEVIAALDQPARPSIWLRFSGDGQHIRKWDFKPFDGGVAYGALPDESR